MIKKLNSAELMDRFTKAETDIKAIDSRLTLLTNAFSKRADVLRQEHAYNNVLLQELREKIGSGANNDTIVFANEDGILSGHYGIYGQTIHPAFVNTPNNAFNFRTSVGYVYKDIATVTINDETKKSYSDILKHDSILDQEPIFQEYNTNSITLSIAIDSTSSLLDRTYNVIEFCPYLPGSFDITSLTLIDINDNELSLDEITHVGSMRICLPTKYAFKSMTMKITLNYQDTTNKFPFGFKHIYFLDADYMDSSIIVPITKQDNIASITEALTIHDQYGVTSSTCSAQGIQIYLYFNGGTLENEITPLNGSNQSYIVRNVKTIYAKVPIDRSLISLSFKSIETR